MNRVYAALFLLAWIFSNLSGTVPTQAAEPLAATVLEQQLLRLSKIPAEAAASIQQLERLVNDAWQESCRLRRPQDALSCLVRQVQDRCRLNRPGLPPEACLEFGDLFASVQFNLREILEPGELRQLQHSQGTKRFTLLQKLLRQHSQALGEAVKTSGTECRAAKAPEGDAEVRARACEALQLEEFCLRYGRFKGASFISCVSTVLYGKYLKASPQ